MFRKFAILGLVLLMVSAATESAIQRTSNPNIKPQSLFL
jgi:hypothetical protein